MVAGTERERTAWVLNLDADLELARGARYTPSNAVRAAMAPHAARLAASLLRPGDVIVDETSPPGAAAGLVGRAFCPTARAIAMLTRAGARPAPHPSQEVLRVVNGRAFASSLGPTLPGGVFATSLEEALVVLAAPPPVATQWRVKRAHGMAGRGQRPIAAGIVGDADRSFLRAAIEDDGGVQIEPEVTIVRELGIHGLLERDRPVRLGRLVEQVCDARGQWLETTVAEDVDRGTAEAITREARMVAAALTAAGYWGPFGIDAFVWRDLGGEVELQPRSEINARYSMGFPVGFGDVTERDVVAVVAGRALQK